MMCIGRVYPARNLILMLKIAWPVRVDQTLTKALETSQRHKKVVAKRQQVCVIYDNSMYLQDLGSESYHPIASMP
jgi:hypothetical protein